MKVIVHALNGFHYAGPSTVETVVLDVTAVKSTNPEIIEVVGGPGGGRCFQHVTKIEVYP